MGRIWFLAIFFISIISTQQGLAQEAASFSSEFRETRKTLNHGKPQTIESARTKIKVWLEDKRLVLISGFMDDQLGGVFTDNLKALDKDFGFKRVTVIKPSSTESVTTNAKLLAQQIFTLHEDHPSEKLVLIAASKGGAEMVLMLVLHPNWLAQERVYRAVALQAAVGGTPLADFVVPRCEPGKEDLICSLFESIPLTREGLGSLTIEKMSKELTPKVFQLSAEQRASFENRLFYVRGRSTFFQTGMAFKIPWLLNDEMAGENDGMIPTANQIIPGLGTDLGILRTDHAGLFAAPFFSNQDYEFRRAFMWSILDHLIDSE